MKYKVQSGDTLSKIADFLLGDMSRWPEIARANNIKAPYTIEIGQVLDVPEIAPLSAGKTASSQIARQPAFSLTAKTPFGLPVQVFGIPTNYLLIGAAALLLIPLLMGRK